MIHGTAKVGRTLRVRHRHWSPGTRFTYTWYAGRKGAEAPTSGDRLRLTKAQKGKRITVKVTGTKPGYAPVSRTSARDDEGDLSHP